MALSKSVLILVMISSGILTVSGGSISSVAVTNKDSLPIVSVPLTATKSLSMINIPQVPEFPKLAARPGKSPSPGGSAPATTNNSQQQQQPQSQNQQQQTQQSSQNVQPTFTHPMMQNMIPPFGLPVAFPSLPAAATQPDAEQVVYESPEISHEEEHRDDQDYSSDGYNESHSEEINTTYYEPVVAPIVAKNESSSNKHAVALQPEKIQDNSGEFPMPLHVMTILNALGSGGSLAQASKPEKDGGSDSNLISLGQGYTTANAIGYATGDNATVTASVSNKMELNTQTVILTESASASASSMSNGTAFSQATLASNGYSSQFGPGGSGWKASNKNPGMHFM